jgi:nitrogen regulatory protein P-II 1
VDFVPKIKLEIVVADDAVDRVIKVIQESAKTGKIGDGKIFVWKIDKAMRIRTAEMNEAAV